MSRGATIILASLALAIGFAAGRGTAPRPDAAPAPPAASRVATDAPRPAPIPDDRCEEALAAAEQRLALATGIIDAQVAERSGEPVPFPEDLPDQYLPGGFEAAVLHAL